MITADVGGQIKIRDLYGMESIRFQHKKKRVSNAIFSKTDSTIITSEGKNIYLWNLKGEKLKTFPSVHKSTISRLAISPNNQQIASVGKDGKTFLWNTKGDTLRSFSGQHPSTLLTVTFSPDGQKLYTGGWNGNIIIWNTETGDTIATYDPNIGHIWAIKFSPDGTHYLVAGGFNKKGGFELRRNGDQLIKKTIADHLITDAKFHPTEPIIITSEYFKQGNNINFWDYEGKKISTFKAHNEGVRRFDITKDGQYIVTASLDKTFKYWKLDKTKPTLLATYNAPQSDVVDISFIEDGKAILSASLNGRASIWMIRDEYLKSDRIAKLTPNEQLELNLVDSSDIDSSRLLILPKASQGNYPYRNFIGWRKDISNNPTAGNYLYTFQATQPLALEGHTVKEKIYLQQLNISYVEKAFALNNNIWEGDEYYSVIRAFAYGNMIDYQIMDNNYSKALEFVNKGKHIKYNEQSQQWFSLKSSLAYLVNNQWDKAIFLINPLKDITIKNKLSFPAKNFNLESEFSKETLFKEVLLSDIKRLKENGAKHPNLEKLKNYLLD